MWATDAIAAEGGPPPRNDLYRLAAVTALLLALFFLAGAWGHLQAVWPRVSADAIDDNARRFWLLLPGLVLAIGCLLNGGLAPALWCRSLLARHFALAGNLLIGGYLAYLLAKGVPGHPIGIFLTLVTSQTLLLLAIALGLVWPSPRAATAAADSQGADHERP